MKKKQHFVQIPRPRPAVLATLLGFAAMPLFAASPVATPAISAMPQEDIRDIRPPIHIPAPLPWLPASAATVGLLAVGYGVWRWTRKGQNALLPYEVALARLEAARSLLEPETAREFSITVSEVVRAFIEQCFPMRATHRTTDEFLHELAAQSDSPLAAHRPALRDFLQHCDVAKFARWQLSVPSMEAMLASARAVVLSVGAPASTSAPAPEPALSPS